MKMLRMTNSVKQIEKNKVFTMGANDFDLKRIKSCKDIMKQYYQEEWNIPEMSLYWMSNIMAIDIKLCYLYDSPNQDYFRNKALLKQNDVWDWKWSFLPLIWECWIDVIKIPVR